MLASQPSQAVPLAPHHTKGGLLPRQLAAIQKQITFRIRLRLGIPSFSPGLKCPSLLTFSIISRRVRQFLFFLIDHSDR